MPKKQRILILGASGFIGCQLYKELSAYFDTYGTFCAASTFKANRRYFKYDAQSDDLVELLKALKPDLVISAMRGPKEVFNTVHAHLVEYARVHAVKLIVLSSANVFDAYSKYPSYENDKTLSESPYGRYQIHIENKVMRLPKEQWLIARAPMVFGNGSPRMLALKNQLQSNEAIEVFPNLSINITYVDKLVQQLHYCINRKKTGIVHLGSSDLVLHQDLTKALIDRLGNYHPLYKRVYTTNEMRYLAVLPRDNKLPNYLQFSVNEAIAHHLEPLT